MSPRIRREESQQQTRQRLLEAAFTVISERGYHAATIDTIAEAAGFSKGAVYSNFASKEELFLALLDHYNAEQMKRWGKFESMLAPALSEGGSSDANDSKDALTYAEHIQKQRSWILLQLEFILNALREETLRVEVATRLRTMRQVMQEHLAAAHAANHTTPTLPMTDLPLYMFSLDIGLALQTLLDPTEIPADAYAPAMRRLLG